MPTDSFPWRNPWREEIAALFTQISSRRKPALRRSLREDFLFAADLPACADDGECRRFLRLSRESGWEGVSLDGWIQLRRADGALPPGWFPARAEGEALCLREILHRHPGSGDPTRDILRLMKAREEGEAAWERACRELHRDYARRLRRKEPLPGIFLE